MKFPDCFISICIPAYKRPKNIDRLLHSISIQSFKNFEIVITDDSPDDSLQPVLQKYAHLPILYHKNETALGTPANWNKAISLANGKWIKLMHDDDWFLTEGSLQHFANGAEKGFKFIFCAYRNVNVLDGTVLENKSFPKGRKGRIVKNPLTLLSENIIGPPSVTLVHRSVTEQYDTYMKWRVDIDFYIRLLQQEKDFCYIDETLVAVGISDTQVTNICINQPEVELPEALLLITKYGVQPLKNILVYDSLWRILRNVGVRTEADLNRFTPYGEWPTIMKKMVQHQARIKPSLLKNGVVSKSAMTLSYLSNLTYTDHFK